MQLVMWHPGAWDEKCIHAQHLLGGQILKSIAKGRRSSLHSHMHSTHIESMVMVPLNSLNMSAMSMGNQHRSNGWTSITERSDLLHHDAVLASQQSRCQSDCVLRRYVVQRSSNGRYPQKASVFNLLVPMMMSC